MTPSQPGEYQFRDAIGGPSVQLRVVEEDGQLLAQFPPIDEDPGAALPVEDMLGDADWSRAA